MRFNPQDFGTAIDASHHMVGDLSYRLNRNHGLLDRIALAVRADCYLSPDSLEARYLFNDALELRLLADKLDRARDALVGNATASLIPAE